MIRLQILMNNSQVSLSLCVRARVCVECGHVRARVRTYLYSLYYIIYTTTKPSVQKLWFGCKNLCVNTPLPPTKKRKRKRKRKKHRRTQTQKSENFGFYTKHESFFSIYARVRHLRAPIWLSLHIYWQQSLYFKTLWLACWILFHHSVLLRTTSFVNNLHILSVCKSMLFGPPLGPH